MAKKSKNRRNQSHRARGRAEDSGEDKRSVALTVAWMMCTLATVGALVLFAISFAMTRNLPFDPTRPNPGAMLPGMALFTAVITGSLTLGSIPVVYRVRQSKPPLAITMGSVLVGITPWIIVLVNRFR